ncbi:hypothetical protein I6F21_14910 [Bradyrhizobium sp. NBAIM03]|uniref:hypothetical protein n=1 Tax=Bradyrhizobium sp. NBAIM03 TaxID=2793816 RepID=UPI001CD69AF1|nr:hypothetical protein [Bradyrhizobium sp. NBAIM03]MCA1533851.1 hypothetical protein [Bradyrhizobium sp. NBAIM03]
MIEVELIRASYRPDRITTLFVGESAPASGDFFYLGNNAMLRHMQRATETALGPADGEFLDRFKAYGWFLDDLVLTPVDKLPPSKRKTTCLAAMDGLKDRIAAYRPLAIVSMLVGIKNIVETAAKAAESNAPRYAVPFPGMGQQTRFQNAMLEIIPSLPRNGIKKGAG